MPNLANAPTFKLVDRRAILDRMLERLQNDPDCRWHFKGPWSRLTADEQTNWDARETVVELLTDFPSATHEPVVEPNHEEAVTQATE